MAARKKSLVELLNQVLRWELAGTIQYLTSAALVTGPLRPVYADFFDDGSKEARGHASTVAAKIAALGGIPTGEPAEIKPSTDLDEMLRNALWLEKNALAAWEAAMAAGDQANAGTRLWIEEMVAEEQGHVDELERIVAGLAAAPAASKASRRVAG